MQREPTLEWLQQQEAAGARTLVPPAPVPPAPDPDPDPSRPAETLVWTGGRLEAGQVVTPSMAEAIVGDYARVRQSRRIAWTVATVEAIALLGILVGIAARY